MPNKLPPRDDDAPRIRYKKKKYRTTRGHGCLVSVMYLAFVLGVSMFLAGVCIICANEVFGFVKADRAGVIEVKENSSAEEIADELKEAGIIEYPSLFTLYAKLSKAEQKFKTGKYELNANMDYSSIARALKRTSTYRETVTVTVPEGYTQTQIIELLVEKQVASKEDLLEAIKSYDFEYSYIRALPKTETRLEGYLFPDTYEFYVNDDAANVIKKFLANFDNKFSAELRNRATLLGLDVDEVVIIASLVEREAKKEEDRATIASVIYNRLASPGTFPYLQIDATVQYLTGEAPTADDLKIDSPYNTYLYSGLPPGAIANPGLASLTAALYPEDTDYYYYVARSDGSHIFSETLDEHNAAIASLRD